MPYKYRNKVFTEHTFYHAYNRGRNKENVFFDTQDYTVFIDLIRKYLDTSFKVNKYLSNGTVVKVVPEKLNKQVELHGYCLMPNHVHMLIYQISKSGMPTFISRMFGAYSHYFNTKHDTVGTLWQGTYKAVPIRSDEQLVQISRYIDLNPLSLLNKSPLQSYPWSSYRYYIQGNTPSWLTTRQILGYFGNKLQRYKQFVEVCLSEGLTPEEAKESKDLLHGITHD